MESEVEERWAADNQMKETKAKRDYHENETHRKKHTNAKRTYNDQTDRVCKQINKEEVKKICETQPLNRWNLAEIGELRCPCAKLFPPGLSASIQMVLFLRCVECICAYHQQSNGKLKERKRDGACLCANMRPKIFMDISIESHRIWLRQWTNHRMNIKKIRNTQTHLHTRIPNNGIHNSTAKWSCLRSNACYYAN